MSRWGYGLVLQQETNHNKNGVETVKGCQFFFSTDVKPRDATQSEQAGVGVVASNLKHCLH